MNQTVLLTGASSGIGLELSRIFAQNQYNLILVARSAQKLEALASELKEKHQINVTVIPADLSQPAAAQTLFDNVQEKNLQVDILVNNAGYGIQADYHEADLTDQIGMMQLNIVTLSVLTRLFLPQMVARKSGKILNVGSTGSFAPVPSMAVYGATKAYVLSFSQAIAEELRNSGVTVSALCPGMTLTGFQDRSGVGDAFLAKIGAMQAVDVAKIAYKGLMHGKRIIIPGLFNKVLIFLTGLTPRRLATSMSRQMME
jgi:uncharacterized protein